MSHSPERNHPPKNNPYNLTTIDIAQDRDIQDLCNLYQSQLNELSACHTLLESDQNRLAELLAPYLSKDGKLIVAEPDSKVLLFKDGLDLRLAEFQEDCKRLEATERRLQRKIDEATCDYENTFMSVCGLADERVLKRIKQLQRTIEIQRNQVDQLRFEKEVLGDESKRLRQLCQSGEFVPDFAWWADEDGRRVNMPSLHRSVEGSYYPSDVFFKNNQGGPRNAGRLPPEYTNLMKHSTDSIRDRLEDEYSRKIDDLMETRDVEERVYERLRREMEYTKEAKHGGMEIANEGKMGSKGEIVSEKIEKEETSSSWFSWLWGSDTKEPPSRKSEFF